MTGVTKGGETVENRRSKPLMEVNESYGNFQQLTPAEGENRNWISASIIQLDSGRNMVGVNRRI